MQEDILIDAVGNARITDFGHARIARNAEPPAGANPCLRLVPIVEPGWQHISPVTKESDIFSFGTIIIEVGVIDPLCANCLIYSEVYTGDFAESLWSLTQRCRSEKPQDRPNIQVVVKVLKDLSVFNSSFERRTSHSCIIPETPVESLHNQESCPWCQRALQWLCLNRVPTTSLLRKAGVNLRC